ncbi:MAG: hypothetical protein B6U69_00405 [Thermofilum sp. ex4484_15]|nr:MAG: hypothetical protein B6U69_00405 [Thermofilum sp. ex4484_15]
MAIYFFYEHPWSLSLKLPIVEETLKGDRALVISDVHIRSWPPRLPREVIRALEDLGVSNLIIAGDLFDNCHFKYSEEELKKLLSLTFKEICDKGIDVYYVVSSSSHDPILPKVSISFRCLNANIKVVRGAFKLKLGNLIVYVTHGDYGSRNGALARLLSEIAKAMGFNLLLERKLKATLRIKPGEWLIMGHTHLPGYSYSAKVANCGSWSPHLLVKASKTFVFLERGGLMLLKA